MKWKSVLAAFLILMTLAACTPQGEESAEDAARIPEAKAPTEDAAGTPEEEEPDGEAQCDAKPVIYLYPEQETAVTVELDYDGTLTTTYPVYENGWNVLAQPDGTLIDPETGREYYCLFWEGMPDWDYDFSQGFCVAGADTRAFLEEALAELGLTEQEANEFLIYWLPQLEGNAYNLLSFQQEAYSDHARLTITPEPDSILRVFLAWKALEEPVEIAPQHLESFQREGFTVVEWGGCKIS